jgi:DNA repair protein RecO (recombination protein O)
VPRGAQLARNQPMHWNDNGLLLSARRHGETSAVVRLLTRAHGVHAGVARGAFGKSKRGLFQPGNVLSANWNARLPEQLGMFTCELTEPFAAYIMPHELPLSLLNAACALLELALPERHPYPRLYDEMLALVSLLAGPRAAEAQLVAYVRFEWLLLAETGFGLDISCCAATGTTEDLLYVSPKSGRAVCREAGEPYKDKLFKLPAFLLAAAHPAPAQAEKDIADGLAITGYFLEHWLLAANGRKMPASRLRLRSTLYKPAETL